MTLGEPSATMERCIETPNFLELDDVLPAERKRLGPSELTDVPLVRLNLLSQVRQAYDPEGINELARSMLLPDGNGGYSINVIQPPTLARLTRIQAIDYIAKINEVFNANHTVDELVSLGEEDDEHEGKYIIVIAGHRRTLAIYNAADVAKEDIQALDVSSNVIDGNDLTFSEAISIQYRENFHRRPDSWEDAFAVNAIYHDGVARGQYKTFADCAEHLSIDADRVARAYRFQTLPEAVRDLVKDEVLQFGRALMLSKIFVAMALNECKTELTDEQKDDFARKLQDNKLYLPELMKHVLEHRQPALRNGFMAHTSKIGTFPTHAKASLYAEQIVQANLGDVIDLRLILNSQEVVDRENDTITRAASREVAVQALRAIVATLRSDQVRIEDGRRTVLGHSARVNSLLKSLTKGIEAAQHTAGRSDAEREEIISEAIASATALAFHIETSDNDANDGEGVDAAGGRENGSLAGSEPDRPPQEDSIF